MLEYSGQDNIVIDRRSRVRFAGIGCQLNINEIKNTLYESNNANFRCLPTTMEGRLRAAPKTEGTTTHTKDERYDRLVRGTDAE